MSTTKKSKKKTNAVVAAVRRSAEQRRRQELVDAHISRAVEDCSVSHYSAIKHLIRAIQILNNGRHFA